jgi:hypothetical protein
MAGSMSRARRRYQIAAATPVVAVFAALYAWAVPIGDPTASVEVFFWLAVLFAMPAFLWLFTSWLLVNHWWEGGGARLSTMDGPGQLMAAAVATLPEPRQSWGQAMRAELALLLPLPTRLPVLAITAGVVVAAVAGAHTLIGAALPGLDFFAASFIAVVGVTVVLAVARARRVRPPVPAATVLVAAAVAASIGAVAAFLAQHPTAAEGLPPGRAAFLAIALAGCLALAAAPPRRLGRSRLAPYLGAGAAVVYALGLLAAARANLDGLVLYLVLFGPALIFSVPAFVATATDRSFRAGVQAGIWTAIMVMPLTIALGLYESSHRYAVDGRWTFAGDAATAGFQVGSAILSFTVIPMLGFPFAVMGATVGALHRSTPPTRTGMPDIA